MMVAATASTATGSLLASTRFIVTMVPLAGPWPCMACSASMIVRSGTRHAMWSTISDRMSWCKPALALPPGLQFTRRSFKAQGLSRALIQAQSYLVEIGLRVARQDGPLYTQEGVVGEE